jgi:hypothetical protein
MTPVPAKRPSLQRRSLLAGAGSLLAAPAIVRAQGANGVALVIGNAKYKWEASLPNVGRDAPDVAKRFQAMGLKTELIQDSGRDAMVAAIDKFKSAASGANLAALYFAGHGVSWDKQTYVVPVDADLSDPKTVKSLITVPSINVAMQGAAHRLLIFDSCRNSPADGWRQREAKALARSSADDKVATDLSTPNTLALFSTASGAVALDGPAGGNSPFAAALFRQLDASSVDLQSLPAKLRRDLLIATECQQMLSDRSTYGAPFVINVAGKSAAAAGARADASRIVELPKAYAFAQQNGLVLPPGLVAWRAAGSASDARMIGSYKYEAYTAVGGSGSPFLVPAIAIVLSVPAGNSAEMVVATKGWMTGTGANWRFVTATRAQDRFAFLALDETADWEFTWRDQNSGKVAVNNRGAQTRGRPHPTAPVAFSRLDG